MRLLLDTQAVLWFYLGDNRLGAKALAAILDPANSKWVSPASFWEVAIKVSIGKMRLHQPFEEFWDNAIFKNDFQVLPVCAAHAARLSTLPFVDPSHRDPFDRLIIAQAMVEDMVLASSDSKMDAYGISRIW